MNLHEDIEVGDIITAYHKDYHKVTKIYGIAPNNVLVDYEQVLNSKFTTKGNGSRNKCNILYCKKVTHDSIQKWAEEQAKFYLDGAKVVQDMLLKELDSKVSQSRKV